MKKNIIIGGIIFHIEEGGYEKLNEFLGSIQRNASCYNAPSAIMNSIENKIAEKLLYKLRDSLPVITVEDVEELIAKKRGLNPTISETKLLFL